MKKMKLFKRSLALACAGTMLASSATAFAAPTGVTGGGDGAVENDNSTAPIYFHVALPTVTAHTYDFTIDTENLLGTYGDSNKYDGTANVYFSAVESGKEAAVAAVAASDKFWTLEKKEDTGAAKLIAELVNTTTPGPVPASFTGKYYVWQPDRTDATTIAAGKGKWTEVTPVIVEKFMALTKDTSGNITAATLKTDNLSGDDIWDGKIYYDKHIEITDLKKAAEYFTFDTDANAVSAVEDGIYIGDGNLGSTTVKIDMSNVTSKVKYTKAEFWNTGTSQPATVKNISSTPVVVTASISLPDDNGLTFQNSTTFTGITTATLCLQLNDGTNNTAVENANGKTGATAYYLLQGANESPITYQGTDLDSATGSHNYYQYVPVESASTYAKVDFTLKGAANGNTDDASKAAWAAYIANLRDGSASKPDISVVYDFDKVTLDTTDASKLKYVGESGAKYSITNVGASEKATLTTPATPPTPTPTAGYQLWDENIPNVGLGYWLGPDAADGTAPFTPGATLTSLTVNGQNIPGTIDNDGWLIVKWSDIVAAGEDSATSWVFLYTVDGTTYTATST